MNESQKLVLLNSKNDFSEKGIYRWFGTKEQARDLLNHVPLYSGKVEVLLFLQLYNFPKGIVKKLYHWNYEAIIFSALFFYLEKKKKESEKKNETDSFLDFLTFTDWILILSLLFSEEGGDKILFFLEKNQFLILLKKSQNKEKLRNLFMAVNYCLRFYSELQTEKSKCKGISNILRFLQLTER